MPKIELAIKEVIDRRAGRRVRQMAIPLRREVRRLRQLVAAVRKDLAALKATAAQWERMADQRLWTATVSDEAANAARLSAGLIRKLRTRFGLSQAALGRLVGVTGPPWWSGSAAGRSRLETGGRRSRPAEAWAPGREAASGPDDQSDSPARPASGPLDATPSLGISTAANAHAANSAGGLHGCEVDQPEPAGELGGRPDA